MDSISTWPAHVGGDADSVKGAHAFGSRAIDGVQCQEKGMFDTLGLALVIGVGGTALLDLWN